MDEALVLERRNRVAGLFVGEGENRISQRCRGEGAAILSDARHVLAPEEPRKHVRHSSPKQVVSMLREQGVAAKVFCLHNSRKQNFEVRSRDYDWLVMPLKKAKVKVPSEIMERVHLLLDWNVAIEHLYIAKPVKHSLPEALKIEAEIQTKQLSQEVGGFFAALAGSGEQTSLGQVITEILTGFLPDPVLIVRLKGHDEIVEIGRWL